MNKNECEKMAVALKVIAHPQRLKIIDVLRNGELSVSQIQNELKIKQSVTSQYLNTMKNQNILQARREGNIVYYSILNKEVLKIISCLKSCSSK